MLIDSHRCIDSASHEEVSGWFPYRPAVLDAEEESKEGRLAPLSNTTQVNGARATLQAVQQGINHFVFKLGSLFLIIP